MKYRRMRKGSKEAFQTDQESDQFISELCKFQVTLALCSMDATLIELKLITTYGKNIKTLINITKNSILKSLLSRVLLCISSSSCPSGDVISIQLDEYMGIRPFDVIEEHS